MVSWVSNLEEMSTNVPSVDSIVGDELPLEGGIVGGSVDTEDVSVAVA